ncbi:hypothetical protein BS329_09325 [Amycolatopsis coloradensis]|uniref:Uncharacterized protein n=1 Tax=Amycolatopsis coloradensis TaxID=76021 RepID=A0A1R0KZA6_9PSEU|nr:hypothetical protein [Amycolatopsis coloradensis]OLZ54691.1 hypothetical protein BS329_09325 [Amycolatopsis coloradensis]
MSESREQRRAREIATLRAAHRPVPRATPKLERVIDIKLRRDTNDGRARPLWSAEWSLRGANLGIERSDEDIAALVENVLEDARLLAEHYAVRLEWTLAGEIIEGGIVVGITLPDFVS